MKKSVASRETAHRSAIRSPPNPRSAPRHLELLAITLDVFSGLVVNGRPIVAGDTRATERVAVSLVTEGDFDLDEFSEISTPFSMEIDMHRVSIYPVLSAVMAIPVFLVARTLFAFNETGCALAGKAAGLDDMIMVFKPGIGIQPGMDPGQMVAFAIILHRQLPVGPDLQPEG